MTMRRLIPLFLVLFVAVSSHAAEAPGGRWTGTIALADSMLDVEIELVERNSRWYGTADFPAQEMRGMPLELIDISVLTGKSTFSIAHIPGGAKFTGTIKGDTLEGTYTQSGEEFPFKLTRKAP